MLGKAKDMYRLQKQAKQVKKQLKFFMSRPDWDRDAVWIEGPSGIGKTSLAWIVANHVVETDWVSKLQVDENAGGQAILDGVRMIQDHFLRCLQAHGLSEIEALGKEFDPYLHEAVSQQITADFPPNRVVAVHQKGYVLAETVLRPARVVVSALPENLGT